MDTRIRAGLTTAKIFLTVVGLVIGLYITFAVLPSSLIFLILAVVGLIFMVSFVYNTVLLKFQSDELIDEHKNSSQSK